MQPCSKENTIDKILERVTDLEIAKGKTETLIEKFTESTKELSTTMKCVEKTLTNIDKSLTKNTDEIRRLDDKVTDKIGIIDKKIVTLQKNDEKNKIDIRDIIKTHFTKILVLLLGGYGVYELLMKMSDK
jgi:vacuolar-type H+-ATPase subunit I/STV1